MATLAAGAILPVHSYCTYVYTNEHLNRFSDIIFTEDHLLMVLSDLFLAGSETTSNTLTFGILFMLRNPKSQRKIQKEIANIVPPERQPCLADAEKFEHYTVL
jgi:hypothetical protein